MKQLIFVCFFFLSVFEISGQVIVNQGFEEPDTVYSGAKGWFGKKAYEAGLDKKVYHSGKSAIYLKYKAGQTFGSFSQVVALPADTVFRKFKLSGYMKRDSVESFAGLWINVFAGKTSLFFDNMGSRGLNGSADWMELSTEFFAEESVTELQIGGLVVGKGQAWFDDFTITQLPIVAGDLPDSLHRYLTEALDLMQKNSLHRKEVDWLNVRSTMFLIASGARKYEDCYPAIRYALGKLGDNHSFLMEAAQSKEWSEPESDAYKAMPLTTGEILDGNIAYLSMPSVSSGSDVANTYFADQLHNLLEKLDQSHPVGWILDLRGNSGGNCWPMLAGIGPVLGEGTCGYFIDVEGTDSGAWFYRKGKSGIGKESITKLGRKPYKLHKKQPKVAVLTGPMTASSGEVVTVAFRNRPNTRSFGQPTMGLSTGNANYALKDGAQIFLTTSVYADRSKVQYGYIIQPDEVIPMAPNAEAPDEALEVAKKWLMTVNH